MSKQGRPKQLFSQPIQNSYVPKFLQAFVTDLEVISKSYMDFSGLTSSFQNIMEEQGGLNELIPDICK